MLSNSNCKTIAICNQKGGVAKTTTSVNIGVGLVRQGKRVLLVDLDPQADLTASLGWPDSDALPATLAEVMGQAIIGECNIVKAAILQHAEGIHLLPSSIGLAEVELKLHGAANRELLLRNCLHGAKDDYDFIIIDCPPSLSLLTVNALAAADSIIIPVQAQYLPAKGMTQLIQTISKVKKQINRNIEISGVVLTLADARTNLSKEIENVLRNQYGSYLRIFSSKIPASVKAAETSALGKSIFSYSGKGKAASAYTELVKEVLADG